ncbi:hypothetical protein JHW43_006655 [Diplocarpon mali]|nr:hypothetical protein JHW43_006655 [Diplocarpon mali]
MGRKEALASSATPETLPGGASSVYQKTTAIPRLCSRLCRKPRDEFIARQDLAAGTSLLELEQSLSTRARPTPRHGRSVSRVFERGARDRITRTPSLAVVQSREETRLGGLANEPRPGRAPSPFTSLISPRW